MHQRPSPDAAVASFDPPLAKLIPHMKNAAARVFHNDPQGNEYIRVTTDNRAVNLLCRYGWLARGVGWWAGLCV